METSPPSVITPSPKNLLPSLHDVETPEKALPPQEVEVAAASKDSPPQEAQATEPEPEDFILDFQSHASRKDQTVIKRENKKKAAAKAAKKAEDEENNKKHVEQAVGCGKGAKGGKSAPFVAESSDEPRRKRSKHADRPAQDETQDEAFDWESLDGLWQHHDVASDQWWQWNPEKWTWEPMLDDTKAEEKDDDEEEEEVVEKETCFARRPPPVTKKCYERWSAIRDAFNQYVIPRVRFPSKYQDQNAHVGSTALLFTRFVLFPLALSGPKYIHCYCICYDLRSLCKAMCPIMFCSLHYRTLSGKLPRSTSRSELMTCRMGLQISLA